MKITYAITVCNEFLEFQRLITFLQEEKRPEDSIAVLYDEANGDPKIEEYLRAKSINNEFNWIKGKFANDFAEWKNTLSSICTGDYIFQIDADEMPAKTLIERLPNILQNNMVDVILVPRINTVEGLTEEHVRKWGWNVGSDGRINFPDYQTRIWKNKMPIRWKNKVHERLTGHRTFAEFPPYDTYCLIHHKTIEKQEKQNNFYESL